MRRRPRAALVAAAALAAALTVGATAAAIQPRTLVLQASDVPAGYELQESSSGDVRAVGVPDVLARGLTRGYYATYWWGDTSARTIVSAAYVYRSAAGARAALAAVDRAARGNAPATLERRRVRIGSGALLYTAHTSERTSAVLWRFDRVLAVLSCASQRDHESLAVALARKQQRRIAAATR